MDAAYNTLEETMAVVVEIGEQMVKFRGEICFEPSYYISTENLKTSYHSLISIPSPFTNCEL